MAAPKSAGAKSIEADAASDAIKEADAAPIADKGFSKAAAAAAARAAARKATAAAETPVSDIIEPAKAASSAADKEAKFAAAAKMMEAEDAADTKLKSKTMSNVSSVVRRANNRTTMAANDTVPETELKVGAATTDEAAAKAKSSSAERAAEPSR